MYGLGLAKGLVITFKNLVMPSRMVAIQYPDRKVGLLGLAKEAGTNPLALLLKEPGQAFKAMAGMATVSERLPQHARFRGEEFTWYEQRCTGCASCAKYCPLGIIKIVTSESGEQVQEGQKYHLDVFDIDIGRCMFCGLCVEACPYDALHMGSGFEEGTYRRDDLVINKDRLVSAPKRPSNWFRPQHTAAHFDPHKAKEGQDVEWSDAGRHEQPSLKDQQDKWAKR
jgi:NADH-quinone oxidoreductase subunit I